jgi:hypothetical protein
MNSPTDHDELAKRLRTAARRIRPVSATQNDTNELRDGLALVMNGLADLAESVAALERRSR